MGTPGGLLVALFVPVAALAATPAQEKAFVDAYRTAYEAKDAKTLHSLLYTKGADPQALEFYRMMTTEGMGGKISSIALEPLTADDKAKAMAAMPGPGGKSVKLPLAPVKKLVIKRTTKDASGSSSSTSTVFVAEADGRLVIPVPGPAK
ncbi:MAG TPA: hypothetical protein VFQ55_12635 [Casimicrobiaceae bacterium]|nr:hypothetical protein [Casimicrobiaceae bacterium]